jgi:hypothetical protein
VSTDCDDVQTTIALARRDHRAEVSFSAMPAHIGMAALSSASTWYGCHPNIDLPKCRTILPCERQLLDHFLPVPVGMVTPCIATLTVPPLIVISVHITSCTSHTRFTKTHDGYGVKRQKGLWGGRAVRCAGSRCGLTCQIEGPEDLEESVIMLITITHLVQESSWLCWGN